MDAGRVVTESILPTSAELTSRGACSSDCSAAWKDAADDRQTFLAAIRHEGLWVPIGTHRFDDEARIVVSNAATDGFVIIDAGQLLPVE